MDSCFKCKNNKDGILIFKCGHDLCLKCAQANFQIQQKKLDQKIDYIFCEFCFKTTQLNKKTIDELIIDKNELQYDSNQYKIYCQIHNDHEVCYFCFDCQCECICPECIIHGDHKDHNVLSLKKAIPKVFKEMQNFTQKQIQKIQTNHQQQQKLQSDFDQITQQHGQQKMEMKKIFQKLNRLERSNFKLNNGQLILEVKIQL